MPNHLNVIFFWRNYTYQEKEIEKKRDKDGGLKSDEQENEGMGNNECSILQTETSNSKRTREIIINNLQTQK